MAAQLVDNFGAGRRGWWKRVEPGRAVLINHDAVRERAQIRAFAAHQHSAKMLVRSSVYGGRPEFGAPVVAGVLEGEFILRRGETRP
jgi:hypothetical protein